jgi:hypothetical protein
LFSLAEISSVRPEPPLVRDVWLGEIQVMAARDRAGESRGWYLAAKGGHNAESHNHNDVGNFIVYRDGRPLIIDAGVETYTRKTFSPQRYEIWTMQSAYHSLPTINGVMQAAGREFAARDVRIEFGDVAAQLTLDLAGAYPPEAGLQAWLRTLTLRRGAGVALEDRYTLRAPAHEITLSLLTPCAVKPGAPGTVHLEEAHLADGRSSGAGMVHYDPDTLTLSTEEIKIEDKRLLPVWGKRLTRLLFQLEKAGMQGGWRIEID